LPIVFGAGWIGIGFLIAAMGDWQRLAQAYPSPGTFKGRRFRLRAGQVGSASYSGFVSGDDVAVRRTRSSWWRVVELQFARVPAVTVRLMPRATETLARASGGRLVIPPPA
jgi:hypothetical protein